VKPPFTDGAGKETLTVAEACRYLGIGKTKFYELVKAKEFATFPLAGRTVVRLEALRAALAKAEQSPHPSRRQRGGKPAQPPPDD
jgi:excisionase family DNA binding protein